MIDNVSLWLQHITGYCIYGGNDLQSGKLLLWGIVFFFVFFPLIFCCGIIGWLLPCFIIPSILLTIGLAILWFVVAKKI